MSIESVMPVWKFQINTYPITKWLGIKLNFFSLVHFPHIRFLYCEPELYLDITVFVTLLDLEKKNFGI